MWREQLDRACEELAEITTKTTHSECVALFLRLRKYSSVLRNSPLSGKISRSDVLSNMHNPPSIKHDILTTNDYAFYRGETDTIHTISPKLVMHVDGWYEHVLFHELAHSVLHKTRLGLHHPYDFLSPEAEIGAELASVFIQLQCGGQLYTDQLAIYIQWQLSRLSISAKHDAKSRTNVLREAAQIGERQARYILGETK